MLLNTRKTAILLLKIIGLALFFGTAFASANTTVGSSVWTMDEAVAMVETMHHGQVLRVRTISEDEASCPIYRLRVLTDSGRIKNYFIDGCVRNFVQVDDESIEDG